MNLPTSACRRRRRVRRSRSAGATSLGAHARRGRRAGARAAGGASRRAGRSCGGRRGRRARRARRAGLVAGGNCLPTSTCLLAALTLARPAHSFDLVVDVQQCPNPQPSLPGVCGGGGGWAGSCRGSARRPAGLRPGRLAGHIHAGMPFFLRNALRPILAFSCQIQTLAVHIQPVLELSRRCLHAALFSRVSLPLLRSPASKVSIRLCSPARHARLRLWQEAARAAGVSHAAPDAALTSGALGSILDWAQLVWAPAPQPGAELAAEALQRLPWDSLLPHLSGGSPFVCSPLGH